VAARAVWDDGITRMLSGDPLAKEQMPTLTKAFQEAHRLFSEEAKHFVGSGPKILKS
jgi:hypothetical protein